MLIALNIHCLMEAGWSCVEQAPGAMPCPRGGCIIGQWWMIDFICGPGGAVAGGYDMHIISFLSCA